MYSLFFTSKRRPFYCAGGACGLQDHSLERVLRNGRFALLRRLSILGSAEPPEQVHADAPQFGNAHGRRDPDDLGSQLRLAVGYVVFELEAVCQVSVSRRAAPSRPRSAFPRAGGRIPPAHHVHAAAQCALQLVAEPRQHEKREPAFGFDTHVDVGRLIVFAARVRAERVHPTDGVGVGDPADFAADMRSRCSVPAAFRRGTTQTAISRA